jgi:hypothetical protein
MTMMGTSGMTTVARITLALTLVAAAPAAAQDSAGDRAGVERAALDYLEGFYEGDTAKIRRGVHPDVTKFGFYVPRGGGAYEGEPMTFQEMLDYADGVKARGNHPPADAPKVVEVLDVLDQTAAAKVTAWWGTDYLQLARYDGQWKILHVLWQTPPR